MVVMEAEQVQGVPDSRHLDDQHAAVRQFLDDSFEVVEMRQAELVQDGAVGAADAQALAGRPTTLEAAEPGDLIFYGTSFVHHVTMYLGKGMMIEAPNSASEVRIVPIRTDDFAGVRTYL